MQSEAAFYHSKRIAVAKTTNVTRADARLIYCHHTLAIDAMGHFNAAFEVVSHEVV